MSAVGIRLEKFKIKLSSIPKDLYKDPCLLKFFALIINH